MERPFPLKWEWPSLGNQGSLLWLSDLQHPLVVAWLPLAPPEARTQHTAHLSSTARTHTHTRPSAEKPRPTQRPACIPPKGCAASYDSHLPLPSPSSSAPSIKEAAHLEGLGLEVQWAQDAVGGHQGGLPGPPAFLGL